MHAALFSNAPHDTATVIARARSIVHDAHADGWRSVPLIPAWAIPNPTAGDSGSGWFEFRHPPPRILPPTGHTTPPPWGTLPRPKRERISGRHFRYWVDLLPRPHAYSAPPPRAVDQRALTRTNPYLLCPPLDLDSDPHARVSWVIPVNGAPFASHFYPSLARLVDPAEGRPDEHSLDASNVLLWSPAALLEFWSELLVPLRAAHTYGPLSLSYIVRPEGAVYVKLGCNAPVATRLRALIGVWKVPDTIADEGIWRATAGSKYHLRILRTARLLLVDCTGKPIAVA